MREASALDLRLVERLKVVVQRRAALVFVGVSVFVSGSGSGFVETCLSLQAG